MSIWNKDHPTGTGDLIEREAAIRCVTGRIQIVAALRALPAAQDGEAERLRAEIERLRVENERNAEISIHAIKQGVEWKARAEKAEAELAALKGATVKPLTGVKALSQDPGNERVLMLHFDHRVTQEDRDRLVAAHNSGILSAPATAPGWNPTHRNVKRGTEYRLMGTARIQSDIPLVDDSEVEIYVGEDCDWWARRKSEFHDGRFVALPIPPEEQEG